MALHRRGRSEGQPCPTSGCYLILSMPQFLLHGRWTAFVQDHFEKQEREFFKIEASNMSGPIPQR